MSRVLAIIPARGGSTRIPGKNLVVLDGVPLLDFTARAALQARSIDAVVISTDDERIAAHAAGLGLANPAMRPNELARDASPTIAAARHALQAYEAIHGHVDAVVVLQPTSPFRTAAHIDEAVALHAQTRADTVTSVRAARDHPYWAWRREGETIVPLFGEAEVTLDRHALPAVYAENGAIYVVRRDLVAIERLYGAHVVPYVMDEYASVDIDTVDDLLWAQFLVERGCVEVPR